MLVYNRLHDSAMRRLKERPSKQYGPDFVAKAEQARKLLGSLHRRAGAAPKRPNTKTIKISGLMVGGFDSYEA
jgi:hypothetical protein